ncbi:unnamed protein product [Cylicostephanus goldi]|uniref:Uncharacterized protein n=1 Tax=Cylicostephanus goldi TaxID=71465 RepID=A0A3P7MIZ2_CYLGO|nr:unnamed protein product [Cylicostephanus goldi]
MDDTFDLTPYSLRLASVVVADEWDMGLPGAFLLSYGLRTNSRYASSAKKLLCAFHVIQSIKRYCKNLGKVC